MTLRYFKPCLLAVALFPVCLGSISQALPFHQSLCDRTGYDESFRDLVQKITIIGTDDRGPLLTKGPELGLSPSEIKQIRQSTGYIFCSGKKNNNAATGSAALIGSNGYIITTAHSIVDENGNFREPLSECFFQNQDKPYQKIPLDIALAKNYRIGARNYDKNHAGDYLIAKLKSPVKGAKPFPVDLSEAILRPNQKMLLVSAYQQDITSNGDQPIIQGCAVGDVGIENPTIIYGNCDIKGGASGGVHLVRNSDGQLMMKAILARGGKGQDGQEFDKDSGVYSYSIGIDGPILRDLKQLYPALSSERGGVNGDRGI